MAYYHTCPHCGANLDPGERCDCLTTPKTEASFLSVIDLAARWAVSVDLVYDLIKKNKVSAMKLGSAWRIPISAVHKFEHDNLTGNQPDKPHPTTKTRKPVLRL